MPSATVAPGYEPVSRVARLFTYL